MAGTKKYIGGNRLQEIFTKLKGEFDKKADKNSLGTSSTKDYTGTVTENSTDLVESGAVYDVIDDVTEQIALKQDAIILDDTTINKYRLGVDNGLLYIETVE